MILSENNPQKSLYVLGANFIRIWKSNGSLEWRIMDAYDAMNHEVQISFSLFMLTLDWLFLIQVLEPTNGGKLKRCS